MRLKELAERFVATLEDIYGKNEAFAIFHICIEHVLGYRRMDYPLKNLEYVDENHENELYAILEELKTGRPVQYVIGKTEFYGLNFKVNEAVLIPRPETEELVDWILTSPNPLEIAVDNHFNVLDVGTGSGCIAISLKKNLPNARVSGLDISKKALSIAMSNSAINETVVDFIHADIRGYQAEKKFNIIVSNPPYVTESEKLEISRNVLDHEPHLALFVGENEPLIYYSAIANFALNNLEELGSLYFEINERFGNEMVELLTNNGFIDIELRKDLQGKDRMIRCRKG